MKTTVLWVEQCVSGMRVAETITNRFNAIIVCEGTILDDRQISKLIYLGYQKIRIYNDTEKEIENHTIAAVQKEYRENVAAMKTVLRDISEGKDLDMQTVVNVSNLMYGRLGDFVGVIACLNQLRDADEYTYTHCLNVAFICIFIGKWLNYTKDPIKDVLQAGLLHDVGKCRIPEQILNKPSSLTEEEFNQMKKHPVLGYNILEGVADVRPTTALAALEHHEKINGKGYPYGLKDDEIHPYGKITAIADIFDAMTSNRVYHRKSSPFQVFGTLENLMNGSLDTRFVLVFLQNLAGYYIGDRVRLSNGEEGTIVYINPKAISKPVIQANNGILNLDEQSYRDLYISDIL